jgi:hypothetical protein
VATYYVRKTGNDGSAGTSAGAAWLTIDKAANTVAAGDVVWIGAGVYRELVTIDTSGSSGSEIEWRADIDGSMTGDRGLVIITRLSDETGTGGTGNCLDINGKTFNEFYDIVFGPSGTGPSDTTISAVTGNTTYQGILFDGCVFLGPADSTNQTITINHGTGGTITGNKPTIQNCYIGGGTSITNGTFAANSACGWQFLNNVFVSQNHGGLFLLSIDGPASGSFGLTGFELSNNTFIGQVQPYINIEDQWAGGTIGTINNNLFFGSPTSAILFAADSGAWTGSNNKITGEVLAGGTVANYTGSNDNTSIGAMIGVMVDHIYRRKFGWSPFAPLEQIWDSNGGGYKSGGIDNASATYAPATDMYGNPKPMGRQNDDVGAVETRTRPARESGTVNTGTYAANFQGAGYHDIMRAVNAASTTITVYCRKDGNYTGTAPKLEVVNIPGVADQSDSLSVAAGNWEQLSVTFTPTSAGWVRIRLWSYDTSATGKCFFDDLV